MGQKSSKIEQNEGKWGLGTTYQDERGQNNINIACFGLKQIETSTNVFFKPKNIKSELYYSQIWVI